MPLGTIDRTPPPFFRQGTSALTKLVFFSALAMFLMASDTRFELIKPVRAAVATALHPIETHAACAGQVLHGVAQYLVGLQDAVRKRGAARGRHLHARPSDC